MTAVRRHALLVVACTVAALPSLVWAVRGAGYLSDDFWIAGWLDQDGVATGMDRIAFERPARPLAAVYYLLLYQVIGEHGAAQAVLLAAINVGLVLALWLLGRDWLPDHVLLPALFVFAALPNHATTRLWFVVGSYPLALALAALGLWWTGRSRPWSAAGAFATAVLLYEGVAGFVALGLAAIVWQRRDDLRRLLAPAGGVVVAAGVMYAISPRRTDAASGGYPGPFAFADTFVPAHFGRGVVDVGALATALAIAVLLVAVVGPVAARVLDADGLGRWSRVVLGGLVLALAGAGPMLVGGSSFGVSGVNDRNNLVGSVGVAVVLAVPAAALAVRSRAAAGVLVAVLVVGGTVQSLQDVDDYVAAVEAGEVFEHDLVAALPDGPPDDPPDGPWAVVPRPEDMHGIAAVINTVDLWGALRLHEGGDWRSLRLFRPEDCDRETHWVRWQEGSVTTEPPPGVCPGR